MVMTFEMLLMALWLELSRSSCHYHESLPLLASVDLLFRHLSSRSPSSCRPVENQLWWSCDTFWKHYKDGKEISINRERGGSFYIDILCT